MPIWPRAVLFDFDGVLVNSEPLHFQAFREVLAARGIQLSEEEYYRDLVGFDDRGAFRHIYAHHTRELTPKEFLSVMAAKTLVMHELIHRKKLGALPGVEDFVRQLWRRCPLAIVSGGLREEIELMLEGITLRDCFTFVVAAEDVTVGKPDAQGYLLAMRRISDRLIAEDKLKRPLKPADCLVIEDAPSVVRNVVKAGFPTIGVCNTYGPQQLADAKYIVDSLQPAEIKKKIPELRIEA